MPCWERVQITEVTLPENVNRKYLLSGFSMLGIEVVANVYGNQTLKFENQNIGELTKDSKVRLTDSSRSDLVKQAYSAGIAKVNAKKKGMQIQKIRIDKQQRVHLTVGKKGGGW